MVENLNKIEKEPFDFGLRAYKEKHFTIYIGVRLDPEQDRIIIENLRKYPNLYKNKSDFIRAAINFFVRHKRDKGLEVI